MCLAIPGQVVDWIEREPPFATATVEFGGVRRQVSMACVPEARCGDYVLVHAGIAISRIDAANAAKILQTFAEMELTESDEFDEIP
jgi:hydrogenase expression/formation protein HypC